ncbi:MAG TPA: DUF5668 domain-containing protein [Bryobacteraceae bacterium]|jgi:hypothetical protein
MNQDSACLLRAIKGPVMMITVGVLFALDNFTPLSFHRTWPVLIVVIGILSLGKRSAALHGRVRYQSAWGPPRPPFPTSAPPPSAPPASAPSGPATAGPGTYRGSTYQDAVGTTVPRGTETKRPDTGAKP